MILVAKLKQIKMYSYRYIVVRTRMPLKTKCPETLVDVPTFKAIAFSGVFVALEIL